MCVCRTTLNASDKTSQAGWRNPVWTPVTMGFYQDPSYIRQAANFIGNAVSRDTRTSNCVFSGRGFPNCCVHVLRFGLQYIQHTLIRANATYLPYLRPYRRRASFLSKLTHRRFWPTPSAMSPSLAYPPNPKRLDVQLKRLPY